MQSILFSIHCSGIKKYSDWPTFPQLYVDSDLVGGLDIAVASLQTKYIVSDLISVRLMVFVFA